MKLTEKEIEAIVLQAAGKINQGEVLANDEAARQEAVDYFKQNAPEQDNVEDLAKLAMSSVLPRDAKKPEMNFNWENAQGKEADLQNPVGEDYRAANPSGKADNSGILGTTIKNYLSSGEFTANYVEYLQEYGLDVNKTAPEPKPNQ